jgi:hypothetical protein
MESRHQLEPQGQKLRRLTLIASAASGAVLVGFWWGGPGAYTWPMTVVVGVLWWLTLQVLRAPNTIILRQDDTLELQRSGRSLRLEVDGLRWIRRIDRSLVLLRHTDGFVLLTRWYSGFDELMKEIKRRNEAVRISV